VDAEKLLIGAASFAGGIVTGLLKSLIPTYGDLVKRISDLEGACELLREENNQLREKNAGLYDALEDEV
jgi:hypothetical protein